MPAALDLFMDRLRSMKKNNSKQQKSWEAFDYQYSLEIRDQLGAMGFEVGKLKNFDSALKDYKKLSEI